VVLNTIVPIAVPSPAIRPSVVVVPIPIDLGLIKESPTVILVDAVINPALTLPVKLPVTLPVISPLKLVAVTTPVTFISEDPTTLPVTSPVTLPVTFPIKLPVTSPENPLTEVMIPVE